MRKTLVMVVAGLTVAACIVTALAGTQYKFVCQDGNCAFKGTYGVGGGFRFEQATGWCEKCRKFVSINWARTGGRAAADTTSAPASTSPSQDVTARIGTVFVPSTGESLPVYKCPDCSGPFLPVNGPLKHCPKCKGANVKCDVHLMYD